MSRIHNRKFVSAIDKQNLRYNTASEVYMYKCVIELLSHKNAASFFTL